MSAMEHIYLNVGFEEKDHVKRLGAMCDGDVFWDADAKKWCWAGYGSLPKPLTQYTDSGSSKRDLLPPEVAKANADVKKMKEVLPRISNIDLLDELSLRKVNVLREIPDLEILKEMVRRGTSALRHFTKQELEQEIKKREQKMDQASEYSFVWAMSDARMHMSVDQEVTLCGLKAINSFEAQRRYNRGEVCRSCQERASEPPSTQG